MIGEASGSSARGELLHLLAHLPSRDAVAHERLVHVEVEEADLGVGHLRERLAVDAHELQQRDEREAGAQDGGEWRSSSRSSSEIRSHRVRVEAHREEEALDQRGLEPGVGGRLVERVRALVRREDLLDEAEGQAPALDRLTDLLERVAALAQARDDARLGDRRGRPAPVARVRHEAVLRPARERLRGDAGAARRLGAGHGAVVVHERAASENQRRDLDDEGPAARGLNVPRRRPTALVHEGRHLAGGEPPTLRPFTLLGLGSHKCGRRWLSTSNVAPQTFRCGYSVSTTSV